MRRYTTVVGGLHTLAFIVVMSAASPAVLAQTTEEAYLGTWRGNASSTEGATTNVALTLTSSNGEFSGVMSGFATGREAPLTSTTLSNGTLTIETTVDSRLGSLSVRYELRLSEDNDVLTGTRYLVFGDQHLLFDVELKKRRRRDVPQPQVEQSIEYFLGTWAFEYTGGEFPPLSIGTRSGQLTVTRRRDSNWAEGTIVGDVFGNSYTEGVTIGFDSENQFLLFKETLSNDVELLSIADWQSPIGIGFVTIPIEYDDRLYQLRRVMSVTSETAFQVTEEFSVDGGPFRRLGNADYQRVN
ncbi:MAG: hypothetical protein VX262_10260 [Acidobacteriota bacterium]|nr:hypothetical protein [Acidobacteriota bacterium]